MAVYDITTGAESDIVGSAGAGGFVEGCQLASDKIAVIYVRGTTLYSKIGTLSGTTWTWGTEATISSDVNGRERRICKAATDKFAVAYAKDSYGAAKAKICSVSGTTITVGSEFDITDYSSESVDCLYISDDKVVFFASNESTSGQCQLVCASISGTTPTLGSKVTAVASIKVRTSTGRLTLLSSDKFLFACAATSNIYFRAYTLSGTTITAGTTNTKSEGTYYYNASLATMGTDKFVYFFNAAGTTNYFMTGSVSGTDVTAGNTTTANAAGDYPSVVAATEDKFALAYYDNNARKTYGVAGTVTGTTITKGTVVELAGGGLAIPRITPVNLSSTSAYRYAALYLDPSTSYPTCQIFDVNFVSSLIKTFNGLSKSSVKTINGLAEASIKNINGLA